MGWFYSHMVGGLKWIQVDSVNAVGSVSFINSYRTDS